MQASLDADVIRESIGKKIRILREQVGITQVDLAKMIGMSSTGAVSQIENGERGIKLQAILRAADALGVHPIVLLTINDIDENGMKIMTNLMKLFGKNRSDPAKARANLEAIKKILDE